MSADPVRQHIPPAAGPEPTEPPPKPTDFRALAQANPVPNMTADWTDRVTSARRHVDNLSSTLRRLDEIAEVLREHGIVLSADLGPIGNAAAAARRDLEKQKPGPTFRMPAGA